MNRQVRGAHSVAIFALVVLVLGLGCGKDDAPPAPEVCLPDPDGKISAQVNGTTWTPEIWGASFIGGSLYVQGETRDSTDHQETVLDLHAIGVTAPGTYSLVPGPTNIPIASYCDQRIAGGTPDPDGDCGFEQAFFTDSVNTGTITVDTLDTAAKQVTGRFSFTGEWQDGLTVLVTNGTFSMKYCDK